ncbi:MAG: hypothetical protein QM790_01675 [Nibricoccus sp.]
MGSNGFRARLKFQKYDGAHDGSGVIAYAIGTDYIVLEFRDQEFYLYSHKKPGRQHVQALKRLAAEGSGLATYINQHVRANYELKLQRPAK